MSQNLRNPSAQINSFPVNERLAVLYTAGRNTSAVSTVDQTVNNSAALVPHAELGIYLGSAPKTTYFIRAYLQLSIAAAANNIQFKLFAPDGLAIDGARSRYTFDFRLNNAADLMIPDQTTVPTTSAALGGTTNAWSLCVIEGTIRPESAGYLGIQFAQNVAGATNTTIKAGSSLMCWEIPA